MTAPRQQPPDPALHAETDRLLMFQPIKGPDRWIAIAMWTRDKSSWGRMTLTEQRVLKIEFQVGTLPQGDGFLPRSAAADLNRWGAFTLDNRTETLPDRLDRLDLTTVIAWARDTTRRRLESPLMASEGQLELADDPRDLTLGELAYLYDALVRLHSKRPTEELAARTGLTTAAARNKIYRARQKGFLTATKPGEPGGRLTLNGWSEAERGPSFKDIERIVKTLFNEED